MDYKLITRGFKATDAVEDYVDRKVSKIQKVLQEGDHVHTEAKIERENKTFRAELTVHIRGAIVRTEESTMDMYASVDSAVDAMEKKLEKYKNKRMSRQRSRANSIAEDMEKLQEFEPEEAASGYEDEEDIEIEKTKRFFLKPMNIEEAKLQLEMLGHNFFVFQNDETDEVNLIYKRQNDSIGLIEFEM